MKQLHLKLLSLVFLFILGMGPIIAQVPEDYGFRQYSFEFEGEKVDYLMTTKKGEEQIAKPLILFVQGSLAKPLFIVNDQGNAFGVFPFDLSSYLDQYHFAIIGKPGIPLSASTKDLQDDFSWLDPQTGNHPELYCKNNNRAYYSRRNVAFLDMIFAEEWIIEDIIMVMGHSEGASIASSMAASTHRVTELILMNGNPLGRTMSMVLEQRKREAGGNNEGSESVFSNWETVIQDPENKDCGKGDPNMTSFSFSEPYINEILSLEMPVMVIYGTADPLVTGSDYLRMLSIRKDKKNIFFKVYPGLEHNFFGTDLKGNPLYEEFYWDVVIADCMNFF